MEKKKDYSSQEKYVKKTYNSYSIRLRKEWNIIQALQKKSKDDNISVNGLIIYAIVELLKKDGYKPTGNLKAYLQTNVFRNEDII